MAEIVSVKLGLEVTTCAACGIVFAFDGATMQARRNDNKSFYCPNGHSLWFYENQIDKLKKQLTQTQKKLNDETENKEYYQRRLHETQDQLDVTARTLKASKTRLRKTKERIAAGVCVWCNRSFQNVARHVAHMHPEHSADEDEKNKSRRCGCGRYHEHVNGTGKCKERGCPCRKFSPIDEDE